MRAWSETGQLVSADKCSSEGWKRGWDRRTDNFGPDGRLIWTSEFSAVGQEVEQVCLPTLRFYGTSPNAAADPRRFALGLPPKVATHSLAALEASD